MLDRLRTELQDHYRVDTELGQGGMAIVYAATDLKHNRRVAVKVLRPELSAVVGAERFLQEIQVTARLQHPHILPLYDSGSAGGLLYYVMPLIEGETLRRRLDREGELPVEDAVSLTRAIAGALDYAHRQGVVHRDIKPENILIHDGQPMLADFGIGLAVSAAGGERLTGTGFSVGTPGYMSPEQMAGDRQLGARSDIYALGCVAYETLAGEPPFTGRTLQAVVTAVMTTDPPPLDERRLAVPESVAAAVHRALERTPADRFPTAAQFAAALSTGNEIMTPRRHRAVTPRRRLLPLALGAAALVLLAGVAGLLAGRRMTRAAPLAVRRWDIVLPENAPVSLTGSESQPTIALSPAGDRLAYVAARGGGTILMVRNLTGDSVTALAGTEGATRPFFSPDGNWIGFIAGNVLRKVPAAGGGAVPLMQVDRVSGVAWVEPDRILLIDHGGFDLHTVSASGARADSTVHLKTQFGEPDPLPGGEWVAGELSSGQLALLSPATGQELAITRRGVLPMDSVRQSDLLFGTSPRWMPAGYLVYAAGDGVLMAMPFDGTRRRVTGEPVPVVTGVRMEAGFGAAEFAIGHDGTLVYLPGRNQLYATFAFVSPGGRVDTLPLPRGPYTQPRLSPDGTQLAVQRRNPVGGWEVLLMNLATGQTQQVRQEGNYRTYPASWMPSGKELMIGIWDPVQMLNYGARIQSLETGRSTDIHLQSGSYMTIAPDGKSFVFSDWRTGELFLRPLDDTTRTPIPARGYAASFSPDGKWVAWGGPDGVGVSPAPPTGAVYRVAERGEMPLWTPKGDGLIYRDGSRYLRAPVTTAGGFRTGRPELLIEGSFLATFAWNHDIAPDGRLLVLLTSPEQQAGRLGVVAGFAGMVGR